MEFVVLPVDPAPNSGEGNPEASRRGLAVGDVPDRSRRGLGVVAAGGCLVILGM
jgi:hypothetical protein